MTVVLEEICLLRGSWQIQQWWSCMNKSEWASWVQAFAVTVALFIPFLRWLFRRRENISVVNRFADDLNQRAEVLIRACEMLKENFDVHIGPREFIDGVLLKIRYFQEPHAIQLAAVASINGNALVDLSSALGGIKLRAEVICDLKSSNSLLDKTGQLQLHLEHQGEKLQEDISILLSVCEKIRYRWFL